MKHSYLKPVVCQIVTKQRLWLSVYTALSMGFASTGFAQPMALSDLFSAEQPAYNAQSVTQSITEIETTLLPKKKKIQTPSNPASGFFTQAPLKEIVAEDSSKEKPSPAAQAPLPGTLNSPKTEPALNTNATSPASVPEAPFKKTQQPVVVAPAVKTNANTTEFTAEKGISHQSVVDSVTTTKAAPEKAVQSPVQDTDTVKKNSYVITPVKQEKTEIQSKVEPLAVVDAEESQQKAPVVDQPEPKVSDKLKKADDNTDVLFDDSVMVGEDTEAAETFDNPNLRTNEEERQSYFTFQLGYEEQLKNIESQHRWIQDALETSIQLGLDLPIKETQKQLLKAHIHQQKAKFNQFKGRDWERDYEIQLSQEVLNNAMLSVMPSNLIEGRAIWLDRGSIVKARNPRQIKTLMRRLHKAGLNVIYFETFNAGYPIYPSELLPQNPLVEGWDPLQAAVEEAHKLGMELHAWVWCFAVGNTKHNPIVNQPEEYPGPVLQEAGLMSEALKMRNGSIMPPRQTEYWLSPASPKARNFLTDLYKEIVTKYDVDGVQLDYIRYPFQRPNDHAGYESVSQRAFKRDTGLSVGSNLKAFAAWKSTQVSQFVKQVSDELRALDDDIKISAAVFPMTRAQRLLAIQQDWETWIQKGWVDALNPMIYTSSPYIFRSSLHRVVNTVNHRAMVYPGIAIFRLDPEEMLGHIQEAEKAGANGSTLFANAQFDKQKQALLKEGPYKNLKAKPAHQSPRERLEELMGLFLADFEKLQTVDGIPYDQKLAIEASVDAAKTFEQGLKAKALPAQLEQQFTDFQRKLTPVLSQVQDEHPYQSAWFGRNVNKMNQLLKYQAHREACCEFHKTN